MERRSLFGALAGALLVPFGIGGQREGVRIGPLTGAWGEIEATKMLFCHKVTSSVGDRDVDILRMDEIPVTRLYGAIFVRKTEIEDYVSVEVDLQRLRKAVLSAERLFCFDARSAKYRRFSMLLPLHGIRPRRK